MKSANDYILFLFTFYKAAQLFLELDFYTCNSNIILK